MTENPTQPVQQTAATPPMAVVAAAAPSKVIVLFQSRKFWAAIIGLAMIVLKAFRPDFPISEDQITGIVVILVGYIMGTAIQDSSIARPTS